MKLRSRWRSLVLTAFGVALVASLAFASPGIRVRYVEGVPQVELEGSYPQSRYTVYRSESPDGAAVPVTAADVLCLGSCYAQDWSAEPGHTYWYRFEILTSENQLVRFGPFAVTISSELASRVRLTVSPNPVHGRSTVEIRLGGAPAEGDVAVEATVLDLQGRVRRRLIRGKAPRGLTSVSWNGDDEAGRALPSGTYFVRVRSDLGDRVTRVLRVR